MKTLKKIWEIIKEIYKAMGFEWSVLILLIICNLFIQNSIYALIILCTMLILSYLDKLEKNRINRKLEKVDKQTREEKVLYCIGLKNEGWNEYFRVEKPLYDALVKRFGSDILEL